MKLSKEILKEIEGHCKSNPEEESCGIVYKCESTKLLKVYKCENTAEDRRETFRISPIDFLSCREKGEAVCIYHSHPTGGEMSEYDLMNSSGHSIPYVMFDLESNKFYYSDDSLVPFLGRKFEYAKADCFSIVEDFYENVLGIKLLVSDTNEKVIRTTEEKDFSDSFNIIEEGLPKVGFKKVLLESFDEIKKYDLLSFKLVNKPRHVGIAVSKSFFLHQMAERLSCVEFLTDAYKRKVINVWRHQELS
mgnify:FL=1